MPYAAQQDIIDRYSQDMLDTTFDRDGTGVADPDAVDRALSDASDEIDGYLAGRYKLPLATPPAILTGFCVDIALYRGSVATAVTEEKRTRYQDAIAFLTNIAKGAVALFSSDPGAPEGGSGATFSAGSRIMTRDRLKGLI